MGYNLIIMVKFNGNIMQEKTHKRLDLSGDPPFIEIRDTAYNALIKVLQSQLKKYPGLQHPENRIARGRILYLSEVIAELRYANSITEIEEHLGGIREVCKEYLNDLANQKKGKLSKMFGRARGTELLTVLRDITMDIKQELMLFRLTKVHKSNLYGNFFKPTRDEEEERKKQTLKDWQRIGGENGVYAYQINGEPLRHECEQVNHLEGFMLSSGLHNDDMRQYILSKAHQSDLFSPLQNFPGEIIGTFQEAELNIILQHQESQYSLIDLTTITLKQLHQIILSRAFGGESIDLNRLAEMLGMHPEFLDDYLNNTFQLSFDKLKSMTSEDEQITSSGYYYQPIFKELYPEEESHVHIQGTLSGNLYDITNNITHPLVGMKMDIDIVKQENEPIQIVNLDLSASEETLNTYNNHKEYIEGSSGGSDITYEEVGNIISNISSAPGSEIKRLKDDVEFMQEQASASLEFKK